MKSIDLFLGIKAEQTLRDVTREAAEESQDDTTAPELCPIGKKDWIAGERIGSTIQFREIGKKGQQVIRCLIDLKSHQRIRHDSLRLYAVRPPVPVFKDPPQVESPSDVPPEPVKEKKESSTCPVCEAEVHKYNLLFDSSGRTVGCYLCRGERRHG